MAIECTVYYGPDVISDFKKLVSFSNSEMLRCMDKISNFLDKSSYSSKEFADEILSCVSEVSLKVESLGFDIGNINLNICLLQNDSMSGYYFSSNSGFDMLLFTNKKNAFKTVVDLIGGILYKKGFGGDFPKCVDEMLMKFNIERDVTFNELRKSMPSNSLFNSLFYISVINSSLNPDAIEESNYYNSINGTLCGPVDKTISFGNCTEVMFELICYLKNHSLYKNDVSLIKCLWLSGSKISELLGIEQPGGCVTTIKPEASED